MHKVQTNQPNYIMGPLRKEQKPNTLVVGADRVDGLTRVSWIWTNKETKSGSVETEEAV
jgi:hypothetical protein